VEGTQCLLGRVEENSSLLVQSLQLEAGRLGPEEGNLGPEEGNLGLEEGMPYPEEGNLGPEEGMPYPEEDSLPYNHQDDRSYLLYQQKF
jgi:hypothetical protein